MAIDKNLIQRSLAGIVFLAIMVGAITYSQKALSCLFMIIAFAGILEFANLMSKKIGLGKGLYLLIGFQAILCGFVFLELIEVFTYQYAVPFAIGFLSFSSAVLFLFGNTNTQRLGLVFTFIFSLIYILIPFLILCITGIGRPDFQVNYVVLYFFIMVWTNDTMAYVTGRLIGKHKLAESISPKKTIEGFIGGLIFTTVISVVVGNYWGNEVGNPTMYWVAPLIVGSFSTIGDLIESSFKRWVDVKDSGNIIPGHGGILDRFDGAIVAVWPYAVLLFFLNR